MNCNCKWTEVVLSAIVLVFALWNSTIKWLPSKWVIVFASGVLLIHALGCHGKSSCDVKPSVVSRKVAKKAVVKKKVAKKKVKKKRR